MKLEDLKKPLPAEAVKPHPTKTYLSSIKAIYVTERFNDVFGIGKWTQKVEDISHNKDNGMVVVKVTFEVPELNIYYESFGGNDNGGSNSKNFDLGDAYKGATTDALTKIGSYLGVGIDVFKGKNNNKKVKDETPVKWLTDNQAQQAIDKGVDTINQTIEYYDGKTVRGGFKYCMSKKLKIVLETALKV